jgi:hypothetical protein
MTLTLAAIIEQKQKDVVGWTLLKKVIEEAKLTPAEEDLIYDSLGLSSPHQIARHTELMDHLMNRQTPIKVHPPRNLQAPDQQKQ